MFPCAAQEPPETKSSHAGSQEAFQGIIAHEFVCCRAVCVRSLLGFGKHLTSFSHLIAACFCGASVCIQVFEQQMPVTIIKTFGGI